MSRELLDNLLLHTRLIHAGSTTHPEAVVAELLPLDPYVSTEIFDDLLESIDTQLSIRIPNIWFGLLQSVLVQRWVFAIRRQKVDVLVVQSDNIAQRVV